MTATPTLSSESLLIDSLQWLKTTADLARGLSVSPAYLEQLVYQPHMRRYVSLHVPKRQSGKFREIRSPNSLLKELQRRLCVVLNAAYRPSASAFGFVSGRNILDNAQAHLREADRRGRPMTFMFNIDLENFFDCIRFNQIYALFSEEYKLTHPVANALAALCCHDGQLPQGAPTSPVVSNMICQRMDRQLEALAERHQCFYTRYADDIAISTSLRRFPVRLAYRTPTEIVVGAEIVDILREHHFVINPAKVKLRDRTERQEVTGIIVNEFPNVRRDYVRQIRAMLHDWKTKGYLAAEYRHQTLVQGRAPHEQRHLNLRSVVRGKIEFLGMVRGKGDPVYNRLLQDFLRLNNALSIDHSGAVHPPSQIIFISHAEKDRPTAIALYTRLKVAGFHPWINSSSGGRNQTDNVLRSSMALVILSSEHTISRRSRVHTEIALFQQAEKDRPRPIVVLDLDQKPLTGPLGNVEAINYQAANSWNLLTQQLTRAFQLQRAAASRSPKIGS